MQQKRSSRSMVEFAMLGPQVEVGAKSTFGRPLLSVLILGFLVLCGPWAVSAEEWELVGLEGISLSSVAVDPLDHQRIIAGPGPDAGDGVWVSGDGGATWQLRTTGLPDPHRVNTIAFQPPAAGARAVVVGSRDILIGTLNFSGPGIYRSSDLGVSWQPIVTGLVGPPFEVTALVFDPLDPDVVFAGRNDPAGGVSKSVDGGTTWADSSMGLGSDGFCQAGCVLDLAIDPESSTILYAAAPALEDVFKTTTSGGTWFATMLGFSAERMAIAPTEPSILLVTGSTFDLGGGLSRTIDSAGVWEDLSGNPALPPLASASHRSIVIDPSDSATAWLLTEDFDPVPTDEAIWTTHDGGATWSRANEGLELVEKVYGLAYQGNSVLAATSSGVYRRVLDLFADGFESGNLTAWSVPFPN